MKNGSKNSNKLKVIKVLLTKYGPKWFLLTNCGPILEVWSVHSLSEFLLLRRQLCSHTPNALNAGAKRRGATCHMAMPQCCYLAKGAKRPSHTTNMKHFFGLVQPKFIFGLVQPKFIFGLVQPKFIFGLVNSRRPVEKNFVCWWIVVYNTGRQ